MFRSGELSVRHIYFNSLLLIIMQLGNMSYLSDIYVLINNNSIVPLHQVVVDLANRAGQIVFKSDKIIYDLISDTD
jgi:hypothetical protein